MNRKLAFIILAAACAVLPTASALPDTPVKTTPVPGSEIADRVEVYVACHFEAGSFDCDVGPCTFGGYYGDAPYHYDERRKEVGVTVHYNPAAPHGEQWGPYTGVRLSCSE